MDFLCRAILEGYKIDLIDDVVLNYRIQENSITHKHYKVQTIYTMYLGEKYKIAYNLGKKEEYNKFISRLIKNPKLGSTLSEKEIINMNKEKDNYNKVINYFKKHSYFKFIKGISKFF